MPTRQQTGSSGESITCAWLEERGYRLIERNLRFGHLEIDLVMADGAQVIFVEVKTVRGSGYGSALELVDRRKVQRLIRATGQYLSTHPGVPSVRIDLVSVTLDARGGWKLEHYINAVP